MSKGVTMLLQVKISDQNQEQIINAIKLIKGVKAVSPEAQEIIEEQILIYAYKADSRGDAYK